ncbi:MAG: hypothetical protein QGG09_01170 [Pirellulaceae bacterium]|nr:hypothetical protein [Pirellulaceae bacterium]HJN11189.1 hypothetical protein [Pirellulaceae bacterium]
MHELDRVEAFGLFDGLSPTEARSAGGPEFICVDTEARSEIRQTTSGAPTGER